MVGQVTNPIPAASRRARRSLVLLIVVAALALGSLSSALDATSSPLTGIRVAASGLILITALGLALRVTIAVEHARRRARADTDPITPRGEPAHPPKRTVTRLVKHE